MHLGQRVKNCWIWWIYVTYRCPAQVETLLDLVLGWNALRASVLQSGLHVRTCRIADEDEIFFRWPMIPRARLGGSAVGGCSVRPCYSGTAAQRSLVELDRDED